MVLDLVEKGKEMTGVLTKQTEMNKKGKMTFILCFNDKVFAR